MLAKGLQSVTPRAGSTFAHVFADWLVVSVDAPLGDLAFLNKRAEDGGSFPAIFGVELAVGRVCALGDTQHDDDRAVGVGFLNGDCVVGNHLEVGGPSGLHFFAATYGVAQRVNKAVLRRHEFGEGIDVVPVDGADEGLRCGGGGIGHAGIVCGI